MSAISICSIDFDMSSTENGMLKIEPFRNIKGIHHTKARYQLFRNSPHKRPGMNLYQLQGISMQTLNHHLREKSC